MIPGTFPAPWWQPPTGQILRVFRPTPETSWSKRTGDVSLPLTHQEALYRVAQEALTNVARHAQALLVTVELRAKPETVTLFVADDGQGFDPAVIEAGSTRGLSGMRERLAGLGGTLTNFRTIRSRLGRLEELEAIRGGDERVFGVLPRRGLTAKPRVAKRTLGCNEGKRRTNPEGVLQG